MKKKYITKQLMMFLKEPKVMVLFLRKLDSATFIAYENNEISEDVLWMRFEDNALRELKMAVEDLRQKID